MKSAIILHGKASQTKYFDPAYASPSNACWFPWLQKQLLMHEILAQTPEMPQPWNPEYLAWSTEFERLNITSNTMLIAHSCGAGFLVRWLSEHSDVRVGKVVLVAPWIDPDRTGQTGSFFNFTFDSKLSKRTAGVIIYTSNNDFPGAQTSAKIIAEAIPNAVTQNFENYGHFVDMTEFAELRDELLNLAHDD